MVLSGMSTGAVPGNGGSSTLRTAGNLDSTAATEGSEFDRESDLRGASAHDAGDLGDEGVEEAGLDVDKEGKEHCEVSVLRDEAEGFLEPFDDPVEHSDTMSAKINAGLLVFMADCMSVMTCDAVLFAQPGCPLVGRLN
mmetsp:Transcript_60797/g.124156  ORF Transcript_60797/g.124156 Transcript_60797/m.124156 type:complete len:139 (-) Transcript_60797:32-448(-)